MFVVFNAWAVRVVESVSLPLILCDVGELLVVPVIELSLCIGLGVHDDKGVVGVVGGFPWNRLRVSRPLD